MKCPNCEINNPDDRKFCYECGSKLLKFALSVIVRTSLEINSVVNAVKI